MNLSLLTYLLNTHYDLLYTLIKQIQLHLGTQGYIIYCLHIRISPYIGLLEIYYLFYD